MMLLMERALNLLNNNKQSRERDLHTQDESCSEKWHCHSDYQKTGRDIIT